MKKRSDDKHMKILKIFSSKNSDKLEKKVEKYAEENHLQILNTSLSVYSNGYDAVYHIAVVYSDVYKQ